MIMTEWVVMMKRVMECVMGGALVLTCVVLMGMLLVWWRAAMLGMWKDIAGGDQVDKIVVMIIVVEMA